MNEHQSTDEWYESDPKAVGIDDYPEITTAGVAPSEDSLSLPDRLELTYLYPTTFRYSLRKCWVSFSFFCLVIIVFVLGSSGDLAGLGNYHGSILHEAEAYLVLLHLAFALGEILFWEIHRRRTRYYLSGGRIHVRRGIIRHLESSAHLGQVTEFFISQTNSDLLLGLYSLLILTPLSPANGFNHFTRIDGLTRTSADGLLAYLASCIQHNQSPPRLQ